MSKEAKIYIFKDRNDYVKKITKDNLYNITGEKGSGKSFFGNLKDNDNSCVIIHLDPVFNPDGNREHDSSKNVRELLIENFGKDLNHSSCFEEKYYNVIVKYLKEKNVTSYIEGCNIAEMQNIPKIVGTVVVKRTGVLKCFLRTIKRDYANEYFMKKEIELYGIFAKITRLYKVIKRRKKIFKSYHNIEKFIDRLEKYNCK